MFLFDTDASVVSLPFQATKEDHKSFDDKKVPLVIDYQKNILEPAYLIPSNNLLETDKKRKSSPVRADREARGIWKALYALNSIQPTSNADISDEEGKEKIGDQQIASEKLAPLTSKNLFLHDHWHDGSRDTSLSRGTVVESMSEDKLCETNIVEPYRGRGQVRWKLPESNENDPKVSQSVTNNDNNSLKAERISIQKLKSCLSEKCKSYIAVEGPPVKQFKDAAELALAAKYQRMLRARRHTSDEDDLTSDADSEEEIEPWTTTVSKIIKPLLPREITPMSFTSRPNVRNLFIYRRKHSDDSNLAANNDDDNESGYSASDESHNGKKIQPLKYGADDQAALF